MAQPGAWDRFKDAVVMSAINNPLWGGTFYRGANRLRGYSNAEINADLANRNAAYAAKYKNAPVFQAPHDLKHQVTGNTPHGLEYLSPDNLGRGATTLLGNLLGGVDPTFAIGGGATRLARIGRQAAVQAVADTGRQAINIHQGTQDKFDRTSPAKAAAMGIVFQGGGEAASAAAKGVKNAFSRVLHETDLHPAVIPDNPSAVLAPDGLPGNGSVRPIDPKTMAKIMNDPEAAGGMGINDNVPARRVNNRDVNPHPDVISDDDLQGLPPANREYLEQQNNVTDMPQAEATPQYDQMAQDFHDGELTPAEAQEMDASVPKPVVDNTGYEAHTPNVEEPVAANDTAPEGVLDTIKRKVGDLLSDERGSLGDGSRFEEQKEDPDGTKYIHYTTDAGDKLPIKMGIEPDGTAEIAVDQFGTGTNKLGPAEIRKAMYGLMDQYPEIKRFGGYRRSGAGAGRVQEIEPTPREGTPDAAVPVDEANGSSTPNNPISALLNDESGKFTPWGKKSDKEKLNDIPDEDLTPEQRVLKGLNAAEPVRQAQDAIYSADRRAKFAGVRAANAIGDGEEGFHQALSAMKGESEKLPSPYSIRPKLEQEDINGLFNKVMSHPSLSDGERLRAGEGLKKLLANSDASVPTRNEMDLLRTVFDPAKGDKQTGLIPGILNIPKSLTTTYDLSAPLRQGVFMVGRKEFYTSLGPMMKALVSEKNESAINQSIFNNKLYSTMYDSGLSLPDARRLGNGGPALASHEEPFMSLASKIPLVGIGVRASERAYNTFIYKLRADTFTTLYNAGKAMGKEWNAESIKSLSKMINTFTGRGDLGRFNNLAPALNIGLYSPRLLKSRIDILNPKFYADMDPFVRKQAFKQLVTFGVMAGTVMGLGHYFGGAEIGADPRTADGWKLKFGNIRHDILGGEKQLIRLYANAATYAYEKGKEVAKTGEIKIGHNERTAVDQAGQFLRNKESPDVSFVHDFAAGNDAVGEHFKIGHAAASRLLPMFPQDANDIVQELKKEGVHTDKLYVESIAHALPDAFGDSVQVYDSKAKTPGRHRSSGFSDFGKGSFGKSFKKGF